MAEKDIIQFLHHDNQDGLKSLYKLYYRPLHYFVKQYVKDHQTSEDIVAETFIKIWENRLKFSSLDSIRSYMYISSKNASINHLRKISTKSENIDINDLENQLFEDSDFLNKLIRTELLKSIFDEVEKLPTKQREILKLTYIEDKSIEEICTLLNMSESAVYTNRSRALANLKKSLGNAYQFQWIILLHLIKMH
jgi:RNA polymerase sigma-70 factor (family 1)